MEKLPDGEEIITIIIRGSTMDIHERRPNDRLQLTMTESES
jgi:hypothetical protein